MSGAKIIFGGLLACLIPLQSLKAQSLDGFRDCKKSVIDKVRSRELSLTEGRKAVKVCSVQYPSVEIYRKCKKGVLRDLAPEEAKQQLKQCYRQARRVDAAQQASTTPFHQVDDRVYFLGIDLHQNFPAMALSKFSKFDCSHLQQVVAGETAPEILLFGHFLDSFMDPKQAQQVASKLAPAKGWKTFPQIGKLGKIKNRAALYFPSGHCSYRSDQLADDDIFLDHKIFYLYEQKKRIVSPYFAVSFYDPSKEEIGISALIEQAQKRLGGEYELIERTDGTRAKTFLTQDKIGSYDPEGDPFNLCAKPRKHDFVVYFRSFPSEPNKLDQLIVVNLKNSCDFGDTVARRELLKVLQSHGRYRTH